MEQIIQGIIPHMWNASQTIFEFEKQILLSTAHLYLGVSELKKKSKRFKPMAYCACKLAYILFCSFINYDS